MRAGILILTVASIMPRGCHTVPTPPLANVPSAPALSSATSDQLSKAAAAVHAAAAGNQQNTDTRTQPAVAGELSVAAANLPQPKAKDSAEAMARLNAALSGDLVTAQAGWTKALGDAASLSARVHDLEAQVTKERTDAAAELARQLSAKDAEIAAAKDKAKREADAKLNFWLQIGCFGGCALCFIVAVASLQLAATVPFFGPMITRCAAIAGGILLALGLIIRSVDRFVDQHPQLFVGALITVGVAAVAAGALAYSNHQHSAQPAAAPAK
jgi:hypothetical protein